MSLSPEQMREQMIDYLYGELEGEALARFEAALRESDQSRRELAELQAALRATRAELARDAHAQPPARVRDAVLQAAAAKSGAGAETSQRPPLWAAVGSWVRSIWILPSLVAATAALLLVLRQGQPLSTPEAPTAPRSEEVAPEPPPSPAAEATSGEATTAAARDGTPAARPEAPVVAPRAAREQSGSVPVAPASQAPAAARHRAAPSGSDGQFAAPPADWRRSPPSDSETRAPSTMRAPARADRAASAELAAPEPAASDAPQTPETRAQRSTPDSVREEAAAPSAAAPSAAGNATLNKRSAELAPAPLTAAALERRAREHAAAKRWRQAVADYRELLRRFPQDGRRKQWSEQLELALRASTPPAPAH